jgi:hypothetical protein
MKIAVPLSFVSKSTMHDSPNYHTKSKIFKPVGVRIWNWPGTQTASKRSVRPTVDWKGTNTDVFWRRQSRSSPWQRTLWPGILIWTDLYLNLILPFMWSELTMNEYNLTDLYLYGFTCIFL